MAKIKIALIGLGKIARDQHIPALAANDYFELVAVASPHNKLSGLPNFDDLSALLDATPGVAAVALCTTPQVRYAIARHALQLGLGFGFSSDQHSDLHFSKLVQGRRIDVDTAPLQLVADAFLCGRHVPVDPFLE
jgi:Oxidoreductase family, NAD-binding Rossmann fold